MRSSKPRQRGSTEQHKADAPACAITVSVVSGQKTKIGVSLRNSKSHQITSSVVFSCDKPLKNKTASYANCPAPNKKRAPDKARPKMSTSMGTTEQDNADAPIYLYVRSNRTCNRPMV